MKRKIAIIHNLPAGGGIRMLNAIINRYKSTCDIDLYSISVSRQPQIKGVNQIFIKQSPWKGFLKYNFWIMFVLPQIHKKIADGINWSKYDLIFVTHDYFTKSPYIIRYINSEIYYLCQEPQREYYEKWSIHAPLLKDKIANIIRYPIKYIDEKNVSYVTKIFVNSKYSKKVIEKIYNKECEIIYPGIDENFFYSTSLEKKKTKWFLCVGGINKVKDQEFLVESLSPLLDSYKIILIGDGKECDKKGVKIKAKNKKSVVIVKNASDERIRDYYRKAMVTCITAHDEPFGLSSVESQACGTPVISINEGGSAETIVDGKTGYLSRRNKLEYCEKIKMAIRNQEYLRNNSIINIKRHWTWDITLEPLDKYFLK